MRVGLQAVAVCAALAVVGVREARACGTPSPCDTTCTCSEFCTLANQARNGQACCGTMEVFTSTPCFAYKCQDDGITASCPTSCSDDTFCFGPKNYCCLTPGTPNCDGTLLNKCVAGSAPGGPCATSAQCQTGHCLGGVCCGGACGTGSPCGASTCDGDGGCIYPTPVCDAGSCLGVTAFPPGVCSQGQCTYPAPVVCPPYLCAAGACTTSCVTTNDCASLAFCDGGLCHASYADGQACSGDAVCQSGHCVGGTCCQTACPFMDALCAPSCPGGTACSYPAGGVCACADAGYRTCSNGTCQPSATPCANNLVCADGVSCYGSCADAGDSACTAGRWCEQGSCTLQSGPGVSCGGNHECLSNSCIGGTCCPGTCLQTGTCGVTMCSSAGTCLYPDTATPCDAGMFCNGHGGCVGPDAGPGPGSDAGPSGSDGGTPGSADGGPAKPIIGWACGCGGGAGPALGLLAALLFAVGRRQALR